MVSVGASPRTATGRARRVPIELTATWRPAGFFGIGAQALANINTSHSLVAVAFVVELGSLP